MLADLTTEPGAAEASLGVAHRAAPGPVADETTTTRLRAPRRGMARLVGLYLVTLLGVVTLMFMLPRAMPGDPLATYADDTSPLTPEARAAYMAHYGLDRPLVEQYGHYLANLATGELGESISNRQPVAFLLRTNLPWTLLLVGTSLSLASLVSFVAGVSAAWRRGRREDRALLVAGTGLDAVPEYALATCLLIVFGVLIRAFPIAGGSTPFTASASVPFKLADVARHLVLPGMALTLGLLGTKFLLVRNTTIAVLGQDYMVAARAKGLPERLLKYHHAGRNALLPFLNVLGIQAGAAMGGSLFVETVFAYPGVASLMVPAVDNLDYPLIEGCFILVAFLVLTANLVVDLVSARLDPRVVGQ